MALGAVAFRLIEGVTSSRPAPPHTRRLTSYESAKAGWPDQNGGSACVAVPLIACFL